MIEQPEEIKQRIYKRRWWTLAVLCLSLIIITIDNSILNVALPTLQRELGASGSELQWIVDAYILAYASLLLTMGGFGDRWGRANALRAGLVIFAGASLAGMLVNSASQLIAARAFMGVGASIIMPATLATIMYVFPREERGKAIGVWAATSAMGTALGPITGGLLIEHFSWSAIFFINIPIAAVALIAGAFLVPKSHDPNPQRLDILGTSLSASMLFMLVFGLIKGGDWGWTDITVIATLTGAVVLCLLFILWERHITTPMLDLSMYRNRRFSVGAISVTTLALVFMGALFIFTLYMQFILGYSALETGIRFLPLAVGSAIGASMSHRNVARFGTNRVVAAGFLGSAILIVCTSFWQTDSTYWVIGPVFFLVSFFWGTIMASSVDSVLGAVPQAKAGVGSAMNSTSVQVGGAIGVAALGSILSSVYSSKIEPLLAGISGLSAEAVEAAKDSVGAATIIAEQLPPVPGEALREVAHNSFMDGWQVMMFVVCGIAVVGAVIVARFMPPRHLPQEQS